MRERKRLTVAVRSLATKDLTRSNTARIIYREALVGFMNGVIFAIIMGGIASLWYYFSGWGDPAGSAALGVVVGVAMIINLLAAGLAGILVPIGLAARRRRPCCFFSRLCHHSD